MQYQESKEDITDMGLQEVYLLRVLSDLRLHFIHRMETFPLKFGFLSFAKFPFWFTWFVLEIIDQYGVKVFVTASYLARHHHLSDVICSITCFM
jgi:hypothetical protein